MPQWKSLCAALSLPETCFNEVEIPVWDSFLKCLSFKSSLLDTSIFVFDKVGLDMPEVRGHVSCHCL